MLQPLTSASILLFNLQNLKFFMIWARQSQKMQDPTAANVFIYFYLNDAYQIRLLKIECSIGLFL